MSDGDEAGDETDAGEKDSADETDRSGDTDETDHSGGTDETDHSSGHDRPAVPESAEVAVAADDHALPLEDLQYPEFTFDEGSVDSDGGFDLRQELDREEMEEWLSSVAGGLTSHDVGVESPDGRVILGVAPQAASFTFDPGEDYVGDFEVSFELRAKAMVVNESDDPKVGARGGKGFIPLAMLTDDEDKSYRCYNWIADPSDG